MAKNWTTAEAAQVIIEGKDKAAIQDIGRRFPLFAVHAAMGVQGLLEILKSTPEHLTVRKIESVLKDGISEDEVEDDEVEEEKPAKKDKKKDKKEEKKKDKKDKDKKKGKKKPDPEEEEDEDEEDDVEEEDEDEDDGLDDMSLPQLRKMAKKKDINIKGLKDKDALIAALRGEDSEEEDEDDDDEDWDL